jgi:hypothetical protein
MTASNHVELGIVTSAEQLEDVARLRYQVHVEELGKRPPNADHERKRLVDELDSVSEVLFVRCNGELIATLRTLYAADTSIPRAFRSYFSLNEFEDYPESTYSFCSRLMIKREHRGSRLLNDVLMESYSRGRKKGVLLNFIGCAPGLIPMYEALGYRLFKPGIFRTELGMDVPMVSLVDDLDYLEKVGSPWAKIAGRFSVGTGRSSWFASRFPRFSNTATCRLRGDVDIGQLAQQLTSPDAELIEGLSTDEIRHLAQYGVLLEVHAGDRIVKEGDYGHELFIVLDGSVEVQADGKDGKPIVLEILGSGQVFGEVAFLTETMRTADVVCTSETRLLSLSQSTLRALMKAEPALCARLLLNLTHILIGKLNLSRNLIRTLA